MGTKKFNIKGDDGKAVSAKTLSEETASAVGYHGPVPPKDTYHVIVKRLELKLNRNKDDMLKMVVEINEKGDKEQYNGYGMWVNLNITKQGAPWVNQWIAAVLGEDKVLAFWQKGVVTDGDGEYGMVNRIAGKPVQDGTLHGYVATKYGNDDKGNSQLDVASWLAGFEPTDDGDVDDDADASDEDEVEVEFEPDDDEDVEAEEDNVEDEEEDGDEEVEEDEDEDEDDDDGAAARLEELQAMSRADLVKIAKEKGIKAVKSKSEADYVKEIMEAEFDEPPF